MRDIFWTSPAQDDLASIDAYWWQHAPHRADRTLDGIESAGSFLRGMPHAGTVLEEGMVRKWSVAGTRYVILYRVLNTRVEVLRIRHGSEDWAADTC